MPLNLASPGIVVKEVDLTLGRVDPTSEGIGAIVGPFAKGPVNEPVLVNNEQELLNTFGNPYATDNHYETWMVASSYLAYGGSLQVVRSDDTQLKNAFAGSGSAPKIRSYEDYVNLGYDENIISGVTVAARNPGSWANGIKVAIIDSKADQILSGFSGLGALGASGVTVGMGVTQSMVGRTKIGAGTTEALDGFLKGVVTEASDTQISVKVLSHVSAAGTETAVDYQPSGTYAFTADGALGIHTAGVATAFGSTTGTTRQDWFDQQKITLSNSEIYWNTLAERPSTSLYAADKGARFDEVHVVVIDDDGDVTGNAGTILEKHVGLSKAKDAEYSVGSTSYWRKYAAEGSQYIFAGGAPAGIVTTGFASGGSGFDLSSDVGWDQDASGIIFAAAGNSTLTLGGGLNYDGASDLDASGALTAGVGDLSTGYDIFANNDEYDVNFLLMGGAGYSREDAQALASKVIAVAEVRKDAVAFVSPCRSELLTTTGNGYTVKGATDITDNLISFYAPVPSSSYAVLDSGYKYMYDRFSDTFRYVPLNGDIAGICARNDATNFPWFSPAGTARGSILNAVKLAYNPSQAQRDRLYSARINPVIFTPGGGITLFGDKTALNKSSAFDRINVRRLFIYLEQAIKGAARDVMFEFNDPLTRSSFVNAVEPFLRDVQAKRGIQDFRLICDETNNTAAIIDANEFIADIYIKPSRSINFIGLTFVATRSGVSFSEVIGNV
jgi:hypothetical protein